MQGNGALAENVQRGKNEKQLNQEIETSIRKYLYFIFL